MRTDAEDAKLWRQLISGHRLTWASGHDGEVKWVRFIYMLEPDISEAKLTETSVMDELAAALLAEAAREGR